MKIKIVLMGGMGYPVTETPWGMPRLKSRFEALGYEVLLVNWAERQQVYNFVQGDGPLAYLGDSLGAGSAAQYPGDIKRPVQFVGGFQPSEYDARSRNIQITVAGNCELAHAVFDPWWMDTAGLGYARYARAADSKTIVLNTEHRGAHPDDWGWSQDLLYHHAVSQLEKK